ncbi:MAG: YfhO family protein [Acidobacteria bacterium]|nr:YfhO family protein [Acidobacteriota bacterium]
MKSSPLLAAASGLLLAALLLFPCLGGTRVPARGDQADFFWPMKTYTADRWASGTGVPFWNPLSGLGEPWLAQLQSGVFYPGDLPFHLPWPWGPLAGIAVHLAIAASGMAALLSGLGSSRRAAIAGGLVFAGGGAFLSLLPVYNNACTAAYLPWLFALARRAVRGHGIHGLALAGALAFLAGEPALAAAGILSACLAALIFRNEGEQGPGVAAQEAVFRLAPATLLAVGLSAAALVPFAFYVRDQGRTETVTREEALGRAVSADELGDLVLAPKLEVLRGAAPALRGGYLITLGMTPLVLVLAMAAPAGFPGRRGLLCFLAVLGAAGALMALGPEGGLAPALFDAGLLKGLRFPARWFVFAHFAMSFAAGAGLDGWLYGRAQRPDDETPGRDRGLLVWASLVGALAVVLLLVALRGGIAQRDLGASASLWAGALVGALALVLAARRPTPPLQRLATFAVLCLLLFSPLVAQEPLASVPADSVHGRPAILSARAAGAGRLFTSAIDRPLLMSWLYDDGAGWTENTPGRLHALLGGYHNLTAGVPTVGSASPIGSPRRARLLAVALTGGSAARTLGLVDTRHLLTPYPPSFPEARLVARTAAIGLFTLDGAMGRAFIARSARAATDDEVAATLRDRAFSPESVALTGPESRAALPAQPISFGTAPKSPDARSFGLVSVARETPEEMELTATVSSNAFLVLTRSYDPGWTAEVDGAPVVLHRTFIALSGLPLGPGTHRVVLRYRPQGFGAGVLLTALSAGLLLVVWLSARPPVSRARPAEGT